MTGSISQVVVVLQPLKKDEEEILLGSQFSFKGNEWVIKQSQNWVKEGGFFRYLAFLLDESLAKEPKWEEGESLL
jgi:hypothetical protein